MFNVRDIIKENVKNTNGEKIDDFIKRALGKDRMNFINYMEIIILPNGEVVMASPSHIEAMIRVSGVNREILYKEMPIHDAPIEWLVDATGCIAVWYNGVIGMQKSTTKQRNTIKKLKLANLVDF